MNKPTVLKLAFLLCAAACSVGTGTLLAFLDAEGPSNVPQRTLTFAERVAYQSAIEDVYWHHRIWSDTNPGPKPPLDKVVSQAEIEKKVEDYLRNSQALEDYWLRPITPDQLQAEMERMASHTKQPGVLREIFAALGNDPFVIAECLARQVLAHRLVTELNNEGSVKLTRIAWRKQPLQSWVATAEPQLPVTMAAVSANYALPAISGQSDNWTPSGLCTDDTWTATSLINAPVARSAHTAVWTGSEMIVWGGYNGSSFFNTGGRYDPGTDSWTATSTTNAPADRERHTAVWTGTEMIVWGGTPGGFSGLNTGGRYNPNTDSWTATSTTNAPAGRFGHTAVLTDSEMIVWGGFGGFPLNTGGRYDPGSNSWTATTTTNAPAARYSYPAVWIGSQMIVWGATDNTSYFNTGGRYNPGTDSWTATSIINAPGGRAYPTAVWTGSQMIVWGGFFPRGPLNTGGRYCAAVATPTPTPTSSPTATSTPTPTASPTPTATPTVTPTATPTATATSTATSTPTATPTATAAATATPSPTPTPTS